MGKKVESTKNHFKRNKNVYIGCGVTMVVFPSQNKHVV
jgi:glycopeptide antibiotics resistance protein